MTEAGGNPKPKCGTEILVVIQAFGYVIPVVWNVCFIFEEEAVLFACFASSIKTVTFTSSCGWWFQDPRDKILEDICVLQRCIAYFFCLIYAFQGTVTPMCFKSHQSMYIS